jgi:threonine dehydratase
MPSISTPSKIAGTRHYTEHVIFSGSTSQEREAKVQEVMAMTDAILVPPYDHPDIILGQGTVGLEMSEQYREMVQHGWRRGDGAQANGTITITITSPQTANRHPPTSDPGLQSSHLDAVLVPLGGGGLLGGIATYFSPSAGQPKTYVFGAEPSFEGCDDARRGLAAIPPKRIDHVSSLTIADGLRTPVGILNWSVVSDRDKVEGVYAVTETQIKDAMRLVFERMKVVIEPSAAVSLGVVLFNEEWRTWVLDRQKEEESRLGLRTGEGRAWDVGVVFSGGNTTMEAVGTLFAQ